MRILELTNYSAGACGTWMRAKQESELLEKKGHTVKIFTSNQIKGQSGTAPPTEKLGNIEIKRFPTKKLGGESFMSWNFEKAALKFNPDIIIAHTYRHMHITRALKLKKKLKCKVFLVTHAPFLSDQNRSLPAKLAVKLYDTFIGPRIINKFDRIITITKWEEPLLKKLGAKKGKVTYIPNGIPQEFFTQKKSKEEKKILFLGRIASVKNLETLIKALNLLKNVKAEIVGPAEEEYLAKLKSLNPNKNIKFLKPIYNTKEKIKKIDSAKIFVLPSIRESHPQSLIEAMAREKIVISSDNLGSNELIQDGKNGFIFKTGNEKQLAKKIEKAFNEPHSEIRKKAKQTVERFSWQKILKKIESIL